MTDINLNILKPSGEVVETCSVSAYCRDGVYYPDSDDWGALLDAYTGMNVIVKAVGDIKVYGLDDNGELKLLTDDGAKDYDNTLSTLLQEFTGSEVENDD